MLSGEQLQRRATTQKWITQEKDVFFQVNTLRFRKKTIWFILLNDISLPVFSDQVKVV